MVEVEWTGEVSRGDWLRERLSGWGVVGGVVPRGFECYARILHPVEACRGEETAEWTWAELARRTGRVMHPLVQSRRFFGGRTYDLAFEDGWSPSLPAEGFLAPELLARLSGHLGVATTTPEDVVVGIWDGWGEVNGSSTPMLVWAPEDGDLPWWQRWVGRLLRPLALARMRRRRRAEREASVDPAIALAVHRTDGHAGPLLLHLPHREYLLLTTTLSELSDPEWPRSARIGWQRSFSGPMPALIWPDDQAWCVATEIDFDSTLVGGSRRLVDSILADPGLETFEVGPDDDLTWDGDTVNPSVGA